MEQPKIKIFGQIYKVILIEFDNKTGLIDRIIYQINEFQHKSVFRGSEMVTESLTSNVKIQKPTKHPFHDYIYSPDLESLLVQGT